MSSRIQTETKHTGAGLAAILLWSTTIAFSRSLTEQLGTFTAAALIYLLAGLLGLLVAEIQCRGAARRMAHLSKPYLWGCGALFAAYMVTLYLSVGLAVNRSQVLVVGLINYLWPGLSLAFSIPILKKKASPWLLVGMLLAFGGVWLATTGDIGIPDSLPGTGWLPYGFALTAAVCWGLYSNLSRKWGAENDGGAVPLFLLASGLLLGVMRLFTPEISHWSAQTLLELAYMAAFPGMLAYILWDLAMRKGNIILIASLSYLTPLFSTLFSTLILRVMPGAFLWLGALLLVTGATICKFSITDDEKASPSPE